MTMLARRTVRHLVRTVRNVRRAGRPTVLGTFRGAEGKQKRLSYTQNISPNREPALDSSTYHHVDFRNGITHSLERPSIPQRLEPDLPIEAVQREVQDGSLQGLTPEQEERFRSQLSKIWDRLETFDKTAEWNDIILSRTKDEWLSQITKHTPVDVKLMLVLPDPPTPAQIKLLPWSKTTDGGVFAWCTKPNGKQDCTKETLYVYIGSASKCHGGLDFRKRYMLAQFTTRHDEGLKVKIKQLDLDSKGEFKRLFRVSLKNGPDADVMDVRELVVLARLVLMIWLGAVNGRLKAKSQDLVPWRLEKIEYMGLATDNPLMARLNKRGGTKK